MNDSTKVSRGPFHGLIEEPITVITAFTDDGLDKIGEVEESAASVAEALARLKEDMKAS